MEMKNGGNNSAMSPASSGDAVQSVLILKAYSQKHPSISTCSSEHF